MTAEPRTGRAILRALLAAALCLAALAGATGAAGATIETGSWATLVNVPRGTTFSASDVACPAVGTCVAAGADSTLGPNAAVAATDGGLWQPPVTFPMVDGARAPDSVLWGVSCATPKACTAVGYQYSHVYWDPDRPPPRAIIVHSDGREWGPGILSPVPADADGSFAQLNDVWCDSADRCVAVGEYGVSPALDGSVPFAVALEGGSPVGGAKRIRLPRNHVHGTLTAVTCTTIDRCTAVGHEADTAHHAFGVDRRDGVWGAPYDLRPASAFRSREDALQGVACRPSGVCVGVGQLDGATLGRRAFVTRFGATSRTTAALPFPTESGLLFGIDCWADDECLTVGTGDIPGDDTTPGRSIGVAGLTSGDGGEIVRVDVPGETLQSLADVSCPAPRSCVAVGGGRRHALAVELEVVDSPTPTAPAGGAPAPAAVPVAAAGGGVAASGVVAAPTDGCAGRAGSPLARCRARVALTASLSACAATPLSARAVCRAAARLRFVRADSAARLRDSLTACAAEPARPARACAEAAAARRRAALRRAAAALRDARCGPLPAGAEARCRTAPVG